MIHVCYALRDESGKYSKFVGTSIQSLLENTKENVTIHILHDSTLSNENQRKLQKLVYILEQEIVFHNVDELLMNEIKKIEKNVQFFDSSRNKIAPFYRLLIPQILSKEVSRVIYLDGDTLVNLDINSLWTINLEGNSIAATPEILAAKDAQNYLKKHPPVKSGVVDSQDYFNSGILVIDLSQVRKLGGGGGINPTRSLPRNSKNFWTGSKINRSRFTECTLQ